MTVRYGNQVIHTLHFPIWTRGEYTKYLTLTLYHIYGDYVTGLEGDGYYIVWSDDFGFICASKVLDDRLQQS